MAKNSVVASYVAEFLKMEQMHVYRQLTGLRHEFDMHVFTRRRFNETFFPYHDKWQHLLPSNLAQSARQLIYERLLQRPPQMSRAELRSWILDLTRVDAQLLHLYFGDSAPMLLPLMKVWARPVVVSFHGAEVAYYERHPLFREAVHQVFGRAKLLLSRSESLANDLIALGAPSEKVRVQRAGIPMEDWPYHERIAPDEGAWQIMQSCRFIEKKGLDTSLHAFAQIAKTFPRAKLLLVGDGPLREGLITLAAELGLADRVEFPGFRPFGNLRNHINDSHLYLHPSRMAKDGDREDVPNAMLEAMATGLPVIATRHGGIPEAISNGENGLLVGENDHEGLAAAMLKLLADQTLRQRLGEAGHRSVAEGFSQSLQSQRLTGLYQELIQRHRSES